MPATFAFEQLESSAPLPPGTPERIIAEAREEADRIRELARAEGYAEGRAAGHQDGVGETTSAAIVLGEALTGVLALRDEVAEAVERDAVELALALATKIVSGALEIQPERVIDIVRGALRRVSDRRRITILVDPSDLEVINAAIGELRAQAGGIELCEVQSDRRVGRGGVIVRTAEGEVDASVDTQLERAREVALSELSNDELERS